jgi:hypothetical protein
MTRLILLVLAIVVSATPLRAQSARPTAEEVAVLAVIDRFMQAITTSDAAALAALRLDERAMTTMARPVAGGGIGIARRAPSMDVLPKGLRERYWDPTVLVRGSIAVVWAPYEFWRDGKTTHCGVDVFDLVKQEGAWRIAHTMYTVEPDACPELRPADPSRIRPTP